MPYVDTTPYEREDFLNQPGDIPMVRVISPNNMVVAVLTPEEFDAKYIQVAE